MARAGAAARQVMIGVRAFRRAARFRHADAADRHCDAIFATAFPAIYFAFAPRRYAIICAFSRRFSMVARLRR